jgi:hypothetical protein
MLKAKIQGITFAASVRIVALDNLGPSCRGDCRGIVGAIIGDDEHTVGCPQLLFDSCERGQQSSALIVSWHQNCNALAKIVVRADTGRGMSAWQYDRRDHLDEKYGDRDSDKSGANHQKYRDDSLHLNNLWVRSITYAVKTGAGGTANCDFRSSHSSTFLQIPNASSHIRILQ